MPGQGYPSSDRPVASLPAPPRGPAPGARTAMPHPDYPNGIPDECPVCGDYRNGEECLTCITRAEDAKRVRRGGWFEFLRDFGSPHGVTAARRCDSCNGAMPDRTSRSRDDKGRLVCDSCKGNNMPEWSTTHSSLDVRAQAEMARREAESIVSIHRVLSMRTQAGYYVADHEGEAMSVVFDSREQAEAEMARLNARPEQRGWSLEVRTATRKTAHDGGDQATIYHCPFCGSGAVTAGSDASVSCDFCHTTFTVQVQPQHPFMPQTIDGVPQDMPGMPQGQPTDLGNPADPTVEEETEDVAADPLGEADPNPPSNGPVAPGQPPSKQPFPPKDKAEKAKEKGGGNQPPWLKKKKSASSNHKQSFRTATGATLAADAYMAHLALSAADDREAVMESVRVGHMVEEAVPPFGLAAEAAGSWVKHQIKAEDIQEGDRLDSSGKTRVDTRHPRTDQVMVKTVTTGTRSPSVERWDLGETVNVWRRA